jgi:arylsulfatase A-like enzyme
VVALLAAVVLAGCRTGTTAGESAASTAPGGGGSRPNIVVIMTDDQTLESMRVMDNTRRLIAEQGTTFSHFYASFPLCCPSRAAFLTGQYSHNNGVRDNVAPNGGANKLEADETLPVWLQRVGYRTASIGKYLNGWGQDGDIAPPPGWDRWFGLIDPSAYQYFGYSVSEDGVRRDYGTAEVDYQTDVLGAEVVRVIGEGARSGQPFFVSFTPLAPHARDPEGSTEAALWPQAEPAPRHAGRFADEPLPRPPSFDRADTTGRPAVVAERPPVVPPIERQMTAAYRLELESLLAVDEWVARIMAALDDNGVADDTVVMFTSDNGLFRGEHRIVAGKVLLYEPAVHVPLVVAGPGFPKGTVVGAPAVNVDLAPTIVGLAQANAGLAMDGADLRRVLADPSAYASRGVLLENQGGGRHTEGIHTGRWVYLEHGSGELELYDLDADPDQLRNLAGTPEVRTTQTQLARRLAVLRTCAGGSCEASSASSAAVPPAPPDPDPSQAASPPPPTRPASSAPSNRPQQVAGLVAAIDALFELTDEEAACATDRIRLAPDLSATADLTSDLSAQGVAALLAIVRGCVADERLAPGLVRVLPLFFATELDAAQLPCVAEALTALPPEQFAAVLADFYDPPEVPDPTRREAAERVLTGCSVDPSRIFG